jgi:hypothetical protein
LGSETVRPPARDPQPTPASVRLWIGIYDANALFRSNRGSARLVKLPADLHQALIANATAFDAWKDMRPLAHNEFICWVEDAKHIRRTQEELEEGQRRPCCKHRDRTSL